MLPHPSLHRCPKYMIITHTHLEKSPIYSIEHYRYWQINDKTLQKRVKRNVGVNCVTSQRTKVEETYNEKQANKLNSLEGGRESFSCTGNQEFDSLCSSKSKSFIIFTAMNNVYRIYSIRSRGFYLLKLIYRPGF